MELIVLLQLQWKNLWEKNKVSKGEKMVRIKTISVLGANGTMGRNIAGIFASYGNAKVYLITRTMEKSRIAISKAI